MLCPGGITLRGEHGKWARVKMPDLPPAHSHVCLLTYIILLDSSPQNNDPLKISQLAISLHVIMDQQYRIR
jgi:hypothetical protein